MNLFKRISLIAKVMCVCFRCSYFVLFEPLATTNTPEVLTKMKSFIKFKLKLKDHIWNMKVKLN